MKAEDRALAGIPPAQWPQALARLAVVTDHIEQAERGDGDAERAARRLGISVRSFYRLLRAYKAIQDGRQSAPSRRGRHSSVDAGTAEAIAEVEERLGRDASDTEIHRAASVLCQDRGLPAPSMTAVRTRTGATPEPVDLRRRTGGAPAPDAGRSRGGGLQTSGRA